MHSSRLDHSGAKNSLPRAEGISIFRGCTSLSLSLALSLALHPPYLPSSLERSLLSYALYVPHQSQNSHFLFFSSSHHGLSSPASFRRRRYLNIRRLSLSIASLGGFEIIVFLRRTNFSVRILKDFAFALFNRNRRR